MIIVIIIYLISFLIAWSLIRQDLLKHKEEARIVHVLCVILPLVNTVIILVFIEWNKINMNKFFNLK